MLSNYDIKYIMYNICVHLIKRFDYLLIKSFYFYYLLFYNSFPILLFMFFLTYQDIFWNLV